MFLDVFVADAVYTISVAYWLTDTLFPVPTLSTVVP